MSDNPVFAYRREVQEYLLASERLLSAATSSPAFSEEELAMIRYYVAEVQKIHNGSSEK